MNLLPIDEWLKSVEAELNEMTLKADLSQAEIWKHYHIPDEFMNTHQDYLSGAVADRWLSWKNIQLQIHLKPRCSLSIWLRKLFSRYDKNKLEDNYKIVSTKSCKKISLTVQFHKKDGKIKSTYSIEN